MKGLSFVLILLGIVTAVLTMYAENKGQEMMGLGLSSLGLIVGFLVLIMETRDELRKKKTFKNWYNEEGQ